MRLTLRTLLAYLDEVLEPADAEELETKIRESDFASGLVHRIRSAMGRLRLSCPEPLARGLIEDANSVGEYIDSTLPEDRLADFERGCLESDMHLSEVAACHQIVTWVVREPAQVPPGMRERIRDLGGARFKIKGGGYQRVDEALAGLEDADEAWKGGVQPNGSVKARADYMQAGRRKSMAPWIVAVLAGFLLTVGYLISTAGKRNQVADSTAAVPPVTDVTEASRPDSAAVPDSTVPATTEPATTEPATTDRDSGFVADDSPTEPGTLASGDEMPAADTAALPVELPPAMSTANDPVDLPPLPETDDPLTADLPLEVATSDETSGAVVADAQLPNETMDNMDTTPDAAADTPPRQPELVASVPAEPAADSMIDQPAATADPTDVAAASTTEPSAAESVMADGEAAPDDAAESPAAPPVAIEAGRYISDREVMAYWDAASGMWLRLSPRATLKMGARMRVPTVFRPQVLLGNGVQLTFAGRSEFSLEPPAAGNSPIIRMSYGRATLVTLGNDADRVAVMAGSQPLEIIFGDQESEFALEVARLMPVGEDPATANRPQLVRVWATSGRIGVRQPGQETRAVETGQLWQSEEAQAAEVAVAEQLPGWISDAQLTDIDRTALLKVEPMLPQDRSLTLSFSEAAESRRQEVRSLAARCLASLERFEPLTAALADPKQHPSWQAQFRELQAAIARNPETAARVREALQTTAGQDADDLYRMLWGYSKLQLEEQAAMQLIDEMESGSLARRVLAFQNLHAATQKTLYYRPEKPPARRHESTNQWRRQLSGGQVIIQPSPYISSND